MPSPGAPTPSNAGAWSDPNGSGLEFDVAISYASEDRVHAQALAGALSRMGLRVFFDRDREAELWGTQLSKRLDEIYSRASRVVVVIVSRHYGTRRWTIHERNALGRRWMHGLPADGVLPVLVEGPPPSWLSNTVGLDLQLGIEPIAMWLREKLAAMSTVLPPPGSSSVALVPNNEATAMHPHYPNQGPPAPSQAMSFQPNVSAAQGGKVRNSGNTRNDHRRGIGAPGIVAIMMVMSGMLATIGWLAFDFVRNAPRNSDGSLTLLGTLTLPASWVGPGEEATGEPTSLDAPVAGLPSTWSVGATPSGAETSLSSQPEPESPSLPAPTVPRGGEVTIEMPLEFATLRGRTCAAKNGEAYVRSDGGFLRNEIVAIADCEGRRWTPAAGARFQTAWSMDPDHNLYLASGRSTRATGLHDIVIAKFDSTGRVVWETSFSTGKTTATPTFAVSTSSGVYIGGQTNGQLPGSPPSAAGGSWQLRFDRSGKLLWSRQEQGPDGRRLVGEVNLDHDSRVQSAAVDDEESLYLLYQGLSGHRRGIQKIDTSGERVWLAVHERTPCPAQSLRVSSTGNVLVYGGTSSKYGGICVARLDGRGNLLWHNVYMPRHSTVIDPVEGTTWQGQGGHPASFALGKDVITLAGVYRNTFTNGASPPPAYDSAWVASIDLEGRVRESRNIRVDPLEVSPGDTGSSVSFRPALVGAQRDGRVELFGTYASRSEQTVVTVDLSGNPPVRAPATASTSVASAPSAASAPSGVASSLLSRLRGG